MQATPTKRHQPNSLASPSIFSNAPIGGSSTPSGLVATAEQGTNTRGQMASWTSPELKAALESVGRNARYCTFWHYARDEGIES